MPYPVQYPGGTVTHGSEVHRSKERIARWSGKCLALRKDTRTMTRTVTRTVTQ